MNPAKNPIVNQPVVERCAIAEVLIVTPLRRVDARGYFCETYNESAFRSVGISNSFVQDNQSMSRRAGTIRGLHFQIEPFAQAKLVRVLKGAIYDVAVDIRTGSPTFGKFVGLTLSAENGHQLYIPRGFAHGFCALDADTEILYKVDAPYSREHERGLCWNDPDIGIPWPEVADETTILERDRNYPSLRSLPACF